MFLFNRIGVGNMITKILLVLTLIITPMSECFASKSAKQVNADHQYKIDNFSKHKSNLYDVTRNTQLSMYEVAAIISVESGFRSWVRNESGSSASGTFQFINSTWKSRLKQFHSVAKVSPKANVFNAKANMAIGVLSLEDDRANLIKRTHLTEQTTTLGDVYIAHYLGIDKAVRVINGNPNVLMSKYVKITKANKSRFIRKGKVLTAAQYRIAMNDLLKNEEKIYRKAIANYQLTRLIEDIDRKKIAINYQQQGKWYESIKQRG